MIGEVEALGIMAEEVAKHVDRKEIVADEVEDSGDDGVPEALSIGLELSGRIVDVHA